MPWCMKVLQSPEKKMDGVRILVEEGENLVGRIAPPAQIVLEGVKVSKKHCVIKVSGEKVHVADLRSSNGLFVNGRKVESADLREKDRLVIGEYVLELAVR